MENILKVKYLYIILNSPITSKGMSGGDKIFIKISEIFRNNFNYKVIFLCCPDSFGMIKNSSKTDFEYILINNISGEGKNIILTYIQRIISLYKIFFIQIKKGSSIISASDFLTDSLVLFLLYLKFGSELKYFTSLFLRKNFDISGGLNSFLYFISQNITILITSIYNFKILTNKIDEDFLISRGIKKESIIILPGGIEKFDEKLGAKKFDGCFIGRISKQKGIDTLLDVCKGIIEVKKNFKLSLIVSGTAKEIDKLKSEIIELKLSKNIYFFGFLDNEKKYRILSQSKLLLFPSRYESFGIVVAESLNLGVPVVAFELEALKINYTKGIVYSKNVTEFKKNVINLLNNKSEIQRLGDEGRKSVEIYNWDTIAKNLSEVLV